MSDHPYSVAYTPPMPVCSVYLGAGGEEPHLGPLEAVLDTGADLTVVPLRTLHALGAKAISQATARSIWGDRLIVRIYAVSLRLDTLHIRALQVLSGGEGDEIILGRNVLNRLYLVLDGPAALAEIFESRTV